MKPADQAAQALKSWLENDSDYDYVVQLVGSWIRKYQNDGSLAILLTIRFGSDPQEQRRELSHEFMTFLFHTFLPKLYKHPDQINALLTDRAGQVLRFALRKFFWQLKDEARKKDVNPRAYLHRRLREVLDQDQQFVVYKDDRNRLSYAPVSHADKLCQNSAAFSPLDFSSLNYKDWPGLPEPGKGREFLFKAKFLSRAALFFWQETARQLCASYAIPVREPVRYLATHYPWLNRNQPDSLHDGSDIEDNATPAEEQLDRINGLASIGALAALFTDGMDDTALRILLWSLEDTPVSFKEMANRLDLPDHNRVYRIYQKTITAMQTFTNNWPGPPLNELPEEVGLAFIESVRKQAKEKVR